MQFTTSLLAGALAYFATAVTAAPSARNALDVWDPTITSPVSGTVWTVGTTVNVTWSTANKPAHVSNGGEIILAVDGLLTLILAPAFDLVAADGSFPVTVPDLVPSDNYQIVLFGDSGNISPSFTVVAA